MDQWNEIFESILRLTGTSTLLTVVVLLVVVALLLSTLAKVLDAAIKLIELVVTSISSCVRFIKGGASKRELVARQKQFLGVLRTDLAGIAKAEAWNDQHFTDLEAEVEVDGKYYASALRKLLRRKSSGLRRERSLIRAIDKSSEKCLLLTGDPGAGKSVALRHLAVQMIERSERSGREIDLIPLYVNLRELTINPGSSVTVDRIREFVIDNVRRGDADTAEYLKSNWDDFQKKGKWFFLFDSFDEIPAVMHAATNDSAVGVYGKAIQQFMDGLGGCRGVLASREYKSPDALAWPKLRILPLSEEKQEELIRKTFLTNQQKETALRAVSLSNSATYKNPLFLTLLCRYVKQNLFAPANEHELLYSHVQSLSKRDCDYVTSKWGLTADELLEGASELARLFAVTPELGLAPTIDEIQVAAQKDPGIAYAEQALNGLIEALTYIKVGRTDVVSSDTAVRRFAFAHRRYQECLFAVSISRNDGTIDHLELVTDARWREYLVALLQISTPASIHGIVEVAGRFVDARADSIHLQVRRFLGVELKTFAWDDPDLEHVLSVFLEAKRYAPDGPWDLLVGPVEKVLGRLWSRGDLFDRQKVIAYCGLGSSSSLSRRLEFSMRSGIRRIEEAGIDACRFLQRPGDQIASWVRRNVTAKIVCARKRFELLRWEAIAAQLPSSYRISACLERAKSVSLRSSVSRGLLFAFDAVEALAVAMMPMSASRKSRVTSGYRKSLNGMKFIGINVVYLILIFCGILFRVTENGVSGVDVIIIVIISPMCVALVKYFIQLSCVSVPERLNLRVVAQHWVEILFPSPALTFLMLGAIIVMSLPGLLFLWVCRVAGLFPDQDSFDLFLFGAFSFFVITLLLVSLVVKYHDKKTFKLARAKVSSSSSLQRALSRADNGAEILAMCQYARTDSVSRDELRAAVSYLSVAVRPQEPGAKMPKWRQNSTRSEVKVAVSELLDCIS